MFLLHGNAKTVTAHNIADNNRKREDNFDKQEQRRNSTVQKLSLLSLEKIRQS